MGKFIVQGINAYCAAAPIFLPGADVKKNHTLVTVIANRGTNKAGVEMRSEVTLNIWGKYAGVAACHLDKGRQISFEGELTSYTEDTGLVGANGKKIPHRRNEVRVDKFWFGADTQKELAQRVGKNLAALQASGQPLSGDALIKITRNATVDYNPALAAQTGMYGNARVYIKGQGFLKPGAAVIPAANVPGPVEREKTMEQLLAEKQALEAKIAASAAGAGVVDAYAGAA